MSWTLEREQLAQELWADGESASYIAARLGGVSRSAVIGKLHRMGLANNRLNPHRTHVSKLRAPRAAPTRADETAGGVSLSPPVVAPPSDPVPLEALEPGMCRYPFGDHAPFTFCGAPVCDAISSYCEKHDRACHNVAAANRKRPGGFTLNLNLGKKVRAA